MEKKRIAILSEEGIGNGILRTPLIRALSPYAIVDAIASERSYDILKMCPSVNAVFKTGDQLPHQYDAAVDCQFTSGLIAREYAAHFKKVYRAQRQFAQKHEVLHSLPFAAEIFPEKKWCGFTPEVFPLDIRKPHNDKRDGIVVHTGCLDTPAWRNRFWAPYKWARLIDELQFAYSCRITLIGHPSEWERCGSIMRAVHGGVDYRSADLLTTTSCIRGAELFVSLDSGMMHLAASQQTPLVALFGPTCARKSHPWAPVNCYRIVQHKVECLGCHILHRDKFDKCNDNVCMKDLSVADVMDEIERLSW